MLQLIIIIIKQGRQCRAGRRQLTQYLFKDPTIPTHREKEETWNAIED